MASGRPPPQGACGRPAAPLAAAKARAGQRISRAVHGASRATVARCVGSPAPNPLRDGDHQSPPRRRRLERARCGSSSASESPEPPHRPTSTAHNRAPFGIAVPSRCGEERIKNPQRETAPTFDLSGQEDGSAPVGGEHPEGGRACLSRARTSAPSDGVPRALTHCDRSAQGRDSPRVRLAADFRTDLRSRASRGGADPGVRVRITFVYVVHAVHPAALCSEYRSPP